VARGRALLHLLLACAPSFASAAPAAHPPAGCSQAAPPRPLPLRPLDLAFVAQDRLVALDGAEVALLSIEAAQVTVLSRRPMPGPLSVVRAPGGVLGVSETESAVWAMTSRSPHAALFAIEGARLAERQQAEAMPFAGAARGLRFRPGTNLIEAEVAGLGPGPFLDLAGAALPVAVTPDGRIVRSETDEARARAGPTLAALWPGLFAASLASPPDQEDAVIVFDTASPATPLLTCRAAGAVRAIAARAREESARLAVALDGADGRPWLHVLDVVRPPR
jgi:hypothetical protein